MNSYKDTNRPGLLLHQKIRENLWPEPNQRSCFRPVINPIIFPSKKSTSSIPTTTPPAPGPPVYRSRCPCTPSPPSSTSLHSPNNEDIQFFQQPQAASLPRK